MSERKLIEAVTLALGYLWASDADARVLQALASALKEAGVESDYLTEILKEDPNDK